MNRPFFWPRHGEAWIGPVGLFWNGLYGIELPSGRFIGLTPNELARIRRLGILAVLKGKK